MKKARDGNNYFAVRKDEIYAWIWNSYVSETVFVIPVMCSNDDDLLLGLNNWKYRLKIDQNTTLVVLPKVNQNQPVTEGLSSRKTRTR